MPAVEILRQSKQSYFDHADLIRARRNALRIARSLPIGPERNQQRQVAISLGRLMRDDDWLEEHVRLIDRFNALRLERQSEPLQICRVSSLRA